MSVGKSWGQTGIDQDIIFQFCLHSECKVIGTNFCHGTTRIAQFGFNIGLDSLCKGGLSMHLGGCRLEVDFNVFPVTFLFVSVGKKIGDVYGHWCPFLKNL
jgi:hypothetical protein